MIRITGHTKLRLKGDAVKTVLVDELDDLTRELGELREAAAIDPAILPTRQQRRKAERQAAKRRGIK